jgi:DNA (cytosine-5)-methyltransferase 1
MSLGIEEAAAAAGLRPHALFALDNNAAACRVYKSNFQPTHLENCEIQDVFEQLGDRVSATEKKLKRALGRLDLIAGGPPCQGHSDLNNFSRRNDPKNALYQYMARAAQVLEPTFLVVENVQGVPHDRSGNFERTVVALDKLGYSLTEFLVNATDLGVPQRRRRHVLIASRRGAVDLDRALDKYRTPLRTVRWAIADLVKKPKAGIIDQPSLPSPDNQRRIKYLFDHNLFDLPNRCRPPCHRDKEQSYNSVYGRIKWDQPSQTVTSGFYSMCMGRYVHPSQRRTLTAHEAARLQFMPDFFDFTPAGNRTALAKMIGNAVPPKLAYVITGALMDRLDLARP